MLRHSHSKQTFTHLSTQMCKRTPLLALAWIHIIKVHVNMRLHNLFFLWPHGLSVKAHRMPDLTRDITSLKLHKGPLVFYNYLSYSLDYIFSTPWKSALVLCFTSRNIFLLIVTFSPSSLLFPPYTPVSSSTPVTLSPQIGLLVACYQGFVDVVIALSQCPYLDVNWQDSEGNTALITASQAGNTQTQTHTNGWFHINKPLTHT